MKSIKIRNIVMTLVVAVALVLTVVNVNIATAPTVAAESEGISAISASSIDVDAVVQLLSADNYKNISCSATSEVVDAARQEGGSNIKEIVEAYLKVDGNYPLRLVKRFGTSILI